MLQHHRSGAVSRVNRSVDRPGGGEEKNSGYSTGDGTGKKIAQPAEMGALRKNCDIGCRKIDKKEGQAGQEGFPVHFEIEEISHQGEV